MIREREELKKISEAYQEVVVEEDDARIAGLRKKIRKYMDNAEMYRKSAALEIQHGNDPKKKAKDRATAQEWEDKATKLRAELKRISEAYNRVVEETELEVKEKAKRYHAEQAKKLAWSLKNEKHKRAAGGAAEKSMKEQIVKHKKNVQELTREIAALGKNEEVMDEQIGSFGTHGSTGGQADKLARKLSKERQEKKAKETEKSDAKAKTKAKKHGKKVRSKAKEKSSGMTAAQLSQAIANAQKRIKVKNKKMKTEKWDKVKTNLKNSIVRDKHKITAWKSLLRKASKNEGFKMSAETRKISDAYEMMLEEMDMSEAERHMKAREKIDAQIEKHRQYIRDMKHEMSALDPDDPRRKDYRDMVKHKADQIQKMIRTKNDLLKGKTKRE